MSGRGLGSWTHLAARFFDVVASRRLDSAELAWVADRLAPAELELFVDQQIADQRHGYAAGRHVAETSSGRPDLVRAAILHDVGKRHAGLGVLGRVLASAAIRLGVPVRGRCALYRDHDSLGASDLAAAGSHRIVVAYAASHHGRPFPEPLSPVDRTILEASDAPARRRHPH